MRTYKLAEFFSGIGSQAKALNRIGIKIDTVCTCEWDIHAFIAYDAIHTAIDVPKTIDSMSREDIFDRLKKYNLSNDGKTAMSHNTLRSYSLDVLKRMLAAIERNNNYVDITSLTGQDMYDGIDILTYSFPCQDLSNVGAFHGYNKGIDKNSGSRSSLLWQVGRILTEMKHLGKKLPRFLVLENVPSLQSPRHIDNFNIWQNDLKELGYHNRVFLLNAANYGIPQNRPRLIMISVLLPNDQSSVEDICSKLDGFYMTHDISDEKYYSQLPFRRFSIKELLRIDYSNPVLFKEALECQPNDTPSRRKIWEENPVLLDSDGNMPYDIVRTLTTKQDRNPNSGNLYFDYTGNTRSKFRYLTPRECFLFMGFDECDFEKVIQNNPYVKKGSLLFPRDKLIRMAGNSIPVNMLERVFELVNLIDKTFTIV